MIKQVENKAELNICLEIIRKSFLTVAEEFGLTEKNCPSHTAFMTADKLEKQWDGFHANCPLIFFVLLPQSPDGASGKPRPTHNL